MTMILRLMLLIMLMPAHVALGQTEPSTRLVLHHEGRFTVELPRTWIPDRALVYDYVRPDRSGYMSAGEFHDIESLDVGCALFSNAVSRQSVIVADQPACKVDIGADGIGLVFQHPNPLESGDGMAATFVWIVVDREHFDAVTNSMQFQLDAVTASQYVQALIDRVMVMSIWRDDIDWRSVRADALDLATNQGNRAAIEYVLGVLQSVGDNHSYFWEPTQLEQYLTIDAGDIPPTQLPAGIRFDDRIGYIALPQISGDTSAHVLYATTGNQVIASLDGPDICGWIIDLRTNLGGNIPPMIAAVGELAGDGQLAGLQAANGQQSWISYQNGMLIQADALPTMSLIENPRYEPETNDLPIAVLVGPGTASAGEFVAIAFIGRTGTQLFGAPSAGLTSGIGGIFLVDGAALGLATSAMIDRTGTAYPNGVTPDVLIESGEPLLQEPTDPVSIAATNWLYQQPACA